MSVEAIVLQAGEGTTLSLRGTGVAYKAAGERPGGGPTFLELTAVPGFSTGDHIHSKIEEIFYVVEGEFQIRAGDRMLTAHGGDFVLVPPGVPHGFGNANGSPAKMVLLISPAAVHERYFEELAEILANPAFTGTLVMRADSMVLNSNSAANANNATATEMQAGSVIELATDDGKLQLSADATSVGSNIRLYARPLSIHDS